MARTGPLPTTWTYALVGGLVALPGTVGLYWQSMDTLTYSPILVGGLVAGYLHDGDRSARRRVGAGTGLIGGLPALWLLRDLLGALPGLAGPAWFRVAATGFGLGATLLVALLAFGLAAVTGVVGATIGGWLSRKTGRRRSLAGN